MKFLINVPKKNLVFHIFLIKEVHGESNITSCCSVSLSRQKELDCNSHSQLKLTTHIGKPQILLRFAMSFVVGKKLSAFRQVNKHKKTLRKWPIFCKD